MGADIIVNPTVLQGSASGSTLMRASDAAAELGLTSQATRDLIRRGKLVGHKGPSNRWLIDRSSLDRYIAEHGRKHGPDTRIKELELRFDELARRVDEMSNRSDRGSARSSVDRERDKYRSQAASMREVARLLVASSSDARMAAAKLLESSGHDLEAVSQLLAPTDPADLMPAEERSEVG